MIRYCYLIFAILLQLFCVSFSGDVFFPEDDPLPIRHERIRRFVRVMSRKPHPDALPETGIGFAGHVKNLMKGGTVGLEFQIPHYDRFGKRFYQWKEIVDSFDYGKKGGDEETKIDEEDNKIDVDEKKFDEEGKVDAEMKRKDFEMLEREDYGGLINPRKILRMRHDP